MSLIKRLSLTLFSGLDNAVSNIENHDALIKAAIDEQQKAISSAKLQLLQLRRKIDQTQKEIITLDNKQEVWKKRAVAVSSKQPDEALSCLQKRREVQTQLQHSIESKMQYDNACKELVANIKIAESDANDVKRKRELLIAKQSNADVLQMMNENTPMALDQLQNNLDRWEAKIFKQYPSTTPYEVENNSFDDLDNKFIQEEEIESLQSELSELIEQAAKGEDHE